MTEKVTLAEAARRTGLSRRTLGRMLTSGTLAGERIDNGWHIPVDALDALDVSPQMRPAEAREVQDLREQLEKALADYRQLDVVREQEVEDAESRAKAAESKIKELEQALGDMRVRAEVQEALAKERAEVGAEMREIIAGLTALLTRQQAIDVMTATPTAPYSRPTRRERRAEKRAKKDQRPS